MTHDGPGIVSHAGATLLTRTATHLGLDHALHVAPAPRRVQHTIHDPGEILLDLALANALGGGFLADINCYASSPTCSAPSPPTRPSPA